MVEGRSVELPAEVVRSSLERGTTLGGVSMNWSLDSMRISAEAINRLNVALASIKAKTQYGGPSGGNCAVEWALERQRLEARKCWGEAEAGAKVQTSNERLLPPELPSFS